MKLQYLENLIAKYTYTSSHTPTTTKIYKTFLGFINNAIVPKEEQNTLLSHCIRAPKEENINLLKRNVKEKKNCFEYLSSGHIKT